MITLSSLVPIARRAGETLRRFPETIVAGLVCAVLSIVLTHRAGLEERLFPHVLAATLAIPLFFSIAMLAEARPERRAVIRVGGLALGLAFLTAFDLTYDKGHSALFWFRYWQFNLGLHLLVAFAPFIGRASVQGFWQYNRRLFLRFLLSALYSATFHIGLVIALWALKSLLGLPISHRAFLDVWILISFIFNTWFFLAGVPENLYELETDQSYPTGLRVFTQYVLLPLVTLYLVILYLYIGKIIGQRHWPNGTIGYLTTGASVLGIFSLLLVHPLRESPAYRWIRGYWSGFYIALYPIVITLALAVWERTGDYGVTERRYFLFIIAAWLAGISTYFNVSARKNIKVVPVTLCVLAFLTAVGPWSAYGVSRRWQMARLQNLLSAAGAFENGKAKPANGAVTVEQRRQISSVMDYFARVHGIETLQPLFGEPLKGKSSSEVMKNLGMEYAESWRGENANYFNFTVAYQSARVVPIAGYDWSLRLNLRGSPVTPQEFFVDGATLTVTMDGKVGDMTFTRGGRTLGTLPVRPLLERLAADHPAERYEIPGDEMLLSADTPAARVKMAVSSIQGNGAADGKSKDLDITVVEGDVFVTLK